MRIVRLTALITLVAGGGILAASYTPPPAAETVFETSAGPVTVTRLLSGLNTPWAVAPLPGGGALITEKGGRLLHFDDAWESRTISGLPEIAVTGQGGLLDVELARDFAETGRLYITYAAPGRGGYRTEMASAVLTPSADRLGDVEILFRQEPVLSGGRHFGSRVLEREDGTLMVTTGDRGDRPRAQDLDGHVGKVVRVAADGSAPADNPFAGRSDVLPEIWSIGHRNIQGADLDEEGRLWTLSHGARGGDEINLAEPGLNYGWPVISYGTHYSGAKIGEGTEKAGMEQPKWYWDPSIAPSGLLVYSGTLFPEWQGDLFAGALKFDYIARLDREGDRLTAEEPLFRDTYSRIRDVVEAPDGAIWFLAVGDGGLYRIAPAD